MRVKLHLLKSNSEFTSENRNYDLIFRFPVKVKLSLLKFSMASIFRHTDLRKCFGT